MRPQILFALFAAAVLIAAGAAYLGSGSSAPDAGLPGPAATVGIEPEQRAEAATELQAPDAAGGDARADERTALAAHDHDPGEGDDGAGEDAPAVAIRVSGRVVDPLGNPVARAEVELVPETSQWIGRSRRSLRGMGAGGQRRTSTAADGRFEIVARSDGEARLEVEASRFAPLKRPLTLVRGVDSLLGDLALDRGVVLAGHVVDSARRPVAGAELRVAPESGGMVVFTSWSDRGEAAATTDADGAFEIDRQAVGPYRLSVTHADHPDAVLSGETREPGEHVTGLSVQLEDGATIRGRVVGAPADAELVVRAQEGSARPGFMLGAFPGGGGREAEVLADGSFTLRGLRAGASYALSLHAPSAHAMHRTARSESLPAKAGDTGVELPYSAGAAIAFQVVDARTGQPLERFTVAAGTLWSMPLAGADGQPVALHPEGRARFEGLRPEPGADTAQLTVEASGYRTYELGAIELEPNATLDLGVLRLEPVPVVRVHVRDRESGAPIEGAAVTLSTGPVDQHGQFITRRVSIGPGDARIDDSSTPKTRSGVTDGEGLCVLSSFPGTDCSLLVTEGDYARFRSETLSLPAEADLDYEVELGRGGAVEVLVVDGAGNPKPGARVRHRDGTGGHVILGARQPHLTTDAEGRVVFDLLEAGTHGFALDEGNRGAGGGGVFALEIAIPGGDGGEWSEVAVAEGRTSQLTLRAAARGELHGIVTEAGAPLVGAKVALREPTGEEGGAAQMRLPEMLGGGTSTVTDASGRYGFEDLKVGEYELEVTHASRAMPASFETLVGEGDNKQNIDLPVAVVEGRVTDEAGKPLPGIRVQARRGDGAEQRAMRFAFVVADDGGGATTYSGPGGEASTETDEGGSFTLRGVLPDVELHVEGRGGKYRTSRSKPFRVAPDHVLDGVDVVMRRAGLLKVSILAPDGAPQNGVLVRASFKGETEEPVAPMAEFVRSGGEVELEGLAGGPWEVTVSRVAMGEGEAPANPDPQTVGIEPGGEHRLTFQMP